MINSKSHEFSLASWILLDTASTVCSIMNTDLLEGIEELDEQIKCYTNGGSMTYSNAGTLKLIPIRVLLNPQGITNILFLGELSKEYRIVLDRGQSNNIILTTHDGESIKYHDMALGKNLEGNQQEGLPCTFLSTGKENKRLFNRRDTKLEDTAVKLQAMI